MMIKQILALALAAAAMPAGAAAQQRFGPSMEVTVGVSTGMGGHFVERGGAGFDGVLAVPVARTSAGTVMVGLSGGIYGKMISELVCVVEPDDSCVPGYPVFASLSGVAGVQRSLGASTSARLMAGAGYYQAVDGGDAFGLQGRVDVARHLGFRTALVASLRGTLLPNYEGDALSVASLGLGLRIQ